MSPSLIWFLIGVALLLSEFVLPGLVVAFFGVGALLTALLTYLGLLTSIEVQAMVFALSSLITLFGLRRYVKQWFYGGSSGSDALEDEFVGKEVRVIADIPGDHSTGKVQLKGADWKASSSTPIPSGSMARVIERKDLTLIVESL